MSGVCVCFRHPANKGANPIQASHHKSKPGAESPVNPPNNIHCPDVISRSVLKMPVNICAESVEELVCVMLARIPNVPFNRDMKILGIDPGLATVGFGVVTVTAAGTFECCQWGTIATSKDKQDGERLQEIYRDVSELVQTFCPDRLVLERLFFFKNAKTLIPVAQARGVILMALSAYGAPVYEYTPMEVKLAITGYGKSTKQEVQQALCHLLPIETVPKPDDAADALAMAVCHYHQTERFCRDSIKATHTRTMPLG